jgi:hypothetical protein
MSKANQFLTNPVKRLIRKANVNVYTYSEIKEMDHDDSTLKAMEGFQAFNDPDRRVIGISDESLDEADELVLHELIHMTGQSTGRIIQDDEVGNQTEEATAQIGMFKLVLVLGLNPACFADVTFDYLKNLTKANYKKADRDSDHAVDYLVEFLGMERVA